MPPWYLDPDLATFGAMAGVALGLGISAAVVAIKDHFGW
jgi:hypothetical protein